MSLVFLLSPGLAYFKSHDNQDDHFLLGNNLLSINFDLGKSVALGVEILVFHLFTNHQNKETNYLLDIKKISIHYYL